MKKKSLLTTFLLLFGLGFYTMLNTSYSTGFPSYTSACGCHGSANAATTVSFVGLPTFYDVGQSYPISVTVSHASQSFAGFQIQTNIGTLTTSDAGISIQSGNKSAGHNTRKPISGGTASFDLIWTAPATGGTAATFDAVGNAVNGSGTGGDVWNSANTSNVALPVSFSSVSAAAIENYINVNFETRTEVDVDRFEIEKSVNGTNFELLKSVSPKGASAYSVRDYNAQPGVNYYRIKEVSQHGQFSYSKVISAIRGQKASLSIYPTLITNSQILIQGLSSDNVEFALMSLTGKKVFSSMIEGQQIDLPSIANGIYLAAIIDNGEILKVQKVVIQ